MLSVILFAGYICSRSVCINLPLICADDLKQKNVTRQTVALLAHCLNHLSVFDVNETISTTFKIFLVFVGITYSQS